MNTYQILKNDTLIKKKSYVLRNMDDKIILVPTNDYNVDLCNIFALNNTGKQILDLFNEKILYGELMKKIIEKFKREKTEIIKKDADDFIKKCLENSILEIIK